MQYVWQGKRSDQIEKSKGNEQLVHFPEKEPYKAFILFEEEARKEKVEWHSEHGQRPDEWRTVMQDGEKMVEHHQRDAQSFGQIDVFYSLLIHLCHFFAMLILVALLSLPSPISVLYH